MYNLQMNKALLFLNPCLNKLNLNQIMLGNIHKWFLTRPPTYHIVAIQIIFWVILDSNLPYSQTSFMHVVCILGFVEPSHICFSLNEHFFILFMPMIITWMEVCMYPGCFLFSRHRPSTVSHTNISPFSELVTTWWASEPAVAFAIHLTGAVCPNNKCLGIRLQPE